MTVALANTLTHCMHKQNSMKCVSAKLSTTASPQGTVHMFMTADALAHISICNVDGEEVLCFLQTPYSPWMWHSRVDCSSHRTDYGYAEFLILPASELSAWRRPCLECEKLEEEEGGMSKWRGDAVICAYFPASFQLRLMEGVQNEDVGGRFRHALHPSVGHSEYAAPNFRLTFGSKPLPPCPQCYPLAPQ